jgi:hypothetical protein
MCKVNRRRMPSDGKSSHCSSFGKAVIEEKITDDGCQVMAKAHIAVHLGKRL